jgi:transcriptional regulator with XRE-family HTH domain
MTRRISSPKTVRVRTQRPWRREEFFRYLEREIAHAQPPIPHVTRLAELAGLSPSTISNWKTGKQRPTLDKLTAIADVLDKPRSELWLQAGLVAGDDVNAEEPAELDPRLEGLDRNDEVVREIMSREDVDEAWRIFALERRRQILELRRQQDLQALEIEIQQMAKRDQDRPRGAA